MSPYPALSPVAFVMTALHPCHLRASGAALARPERYDDSEFWEQVIGLLERFEGIPLGLGVVRRSVWFKSLPAGVASQIEEHLARWKMIALDRDVEMKAAVRILNHANIPVLVCGSYGIGLKAYPDPAWRVSRTTQLQVSQGGFYAAMRVLGSEGFRSTIESGPMTGSTLLTRGGHPLGSAIQLSDRFHTDDSHFSTSQIWDRSVPLHSLGGIPHKVRTLSWCDAVVATLRQGAAQLMSRRKSMASPLILNDLHFLFTAESLRAERNGNEAALSSMIFDRDLEAAAWLVLHVLSQEWETAVSPSLLQGLRNGLSPIRRRALRGIARLDRLFPEESGGMLDPKRFRFLAAGLRV